MISDVDASLRTLRDRARGPRKTITAFGPESYADLEPVLDQLNVDLTHERLPIPESAGYLTVEAGERYLGTVSAAAFSELDDLQRGAPWDEETRTSARRDLVALLSGTGFTMDDKRHLIATTREIEDRAWRTGGGTLYAGFQSLSAFEAQIPVYERLVTDTDLRAVVFGEPDWDPPSLEGVTVHRDGDGDLADFWVVAFDGAGDDDEKCALLAEETETRQYSGVVTYDAAVVDDIVAHLDGVVG